MWVFCLRLHCVAVPGEKLALFLFFPEKRIDGDREEKKRGNWTNNGGIQEGLQTVATVTRGAGIMATSEIIVSRTLVSFMFNRVFRFCFGRLIFMIRIRGRLCPGPSTWQTWLFEEDLWKLIRTHEDFSCLWTVHARFCRENGSLCAQRSHPSQLLQSWNCDKATTC